MALPHPIKNVNNKEAIEAEGAEETRQGKGCKRKRETAPRTRDVGYYPTA